MTAVGGRDLREPKRFGQRDDGRVDEPELEIGKPAIQLATLAWPLRGRSATR